MIPLVDKPKRFQVQLVQDCSDMLDLFLVTDHDRNFPKVEDWILIIIEPLEKLLESLLRRRSASRE